MLSSDFFRTAERIGTARTRAMTVIRMGGSWRSDRAKDCEARSETAGATASWICEVAREGEVTKSETVEEMEPSNHAIKV